MTFESWYTLILLILMSIALIKEWLETEIAIFGTLLLLLIANIISVEEAFIGFSNPGVLTIGLLFVVAGAIYNTGFLQRLNRIIFGEKDTSLTRKLPRILFPISAISAFMNNTPVVALMIPAVRAWAEKYHHAASKLLIPVSFAAILGGMCTLIGTSTNLIVHGLMIDFGADGLTMFEISKVGIPVALVGLLFLITVGPHLLPDRKEPLVELGEKTREFVIELKVTEAYQNIGKTIEEAGLRHLKGLFLFQIERQGRIIAPAPPNERIQLGDRLFFTGIPKTILELQKTPGLQLIKDSTFDLKQYDHSQIKAYEAVVSPSSPLVGKNVRESNFRGKYGAVIIAIHRNGERIQQKIGDIVLRAGDTLLLLADRHFRQKWYHSNDFYLISSAEEVPSRPLWQGYLSLAIFLGMVVLAVTRVLPLVTAAALAVMLLILTRCVTPREAQQFIDFRVLITIAAAFGISEAMHNSGLSDILGRQLIVLGNHFGMVGIVAAIFIVTSLYTTVITSNATAALIFPIAFAVAQSTGMDLRPLAITVAIAAAGSFATPISYQTNMMVYGPGGYRFKDFLRIGIPMQLVTGVVAVGLIYWVYF